MNYVPRDIRTNGRKDRAFVTFARICALTIVLTLVGPCCLGIASVGVDGPRGDPSLARTTAQSVHVPILIEGDDEFTEENGVVDGIGTEDEPYVISGWAIDIEGASYPNCAVRIANTTAAFVVTDVSVHGGEYTSARGIYLNNVTSGTIEACTIEELNTGIGVQSSSRVNITSNKLIGCDCAISGSENVSFEYNEESNVAVHVGSSKNISVSYNEVNYDLSPDYPKGLTISLTNCDRCTILGNTLWKAAETGDSWWTSISLSMSTNCTVDDNEMNAPGLGLDASSVEYISTHMIGKNNTVRMLPLRFYKDASGIVIDRTDFGQLIIYDCSDVRLRDLTAVGLRGFVQITSCSDVEITDCVFIDSRGITVSGSSDVRMRHNAFENRSEIWIKYCSGVDFSDNRMTDSGFYASHMNDSLIADSAFVGNSTSETSISSSVNLTLHGNRFSSGGLRYQGDSAREYESLAIDQSNLGVGGKPILFLKSQTDLKVDLSNYSQLLMGNCSEIDARGMTTSASWAIQIGFSAGVSVYGCGIYGYHPIDLRYADGITFYENDFVNPIFLMHLFMTHNVTTYHCNILGSYGGWSWGGFDNYTPTNIRWDNGYPDGGNYWEGWKAYDIYSGPAQDEPGSDGICDQPREMPWGYDRYPLATPYVRGWTGEPDSVWQDPVLWLSALAGIVIASIAISYVLFVKEGPRKPEPAPPENREGA